MFRQEIPHPSNRNQCDIHDRTWVLDQNHGVCSAGCLNSGLTTALGHDEAVSGGMPEIKLEAISVFGAELEARLEGVTNVALPVVGRSD